MKKGLYIIAVALIPVFFSACQEDKDPFGGKLPSERMEAAINKLDSTLLSAPYGWEMQYFAKPNTAGYPLLVKFQANSEVLVAAQNRNTLRTYKEAVSFYDVREGNGAMLSFETYNEVLHSFSNPENPAGKGQEGDYEFYVEANGYSQSGDTLILSGKKRGSRIIMVKLTNEWQNWADYFVALTKIDELTFANNTGSAYTMKLSGAGPTVTYNEFVFQSEEGDYGFILTPKGLRLYNGFKRNEDIAYNFELDDLVNPTKFVCVDPGINAVIEPRYTPIRVFQNAVTSKTDVWSIDLNKVGTAFEAALDVVKSSLITSGAALAELDLLYVSEANKPALRVRYRVDGREYEARIFFEYTFSPRSNPTSLTVKYSSVNEDGASFLKRLGNGDQQVGLDMVKALFEHQYEISCAVGGHFNTSSLMFKAKDNPSLTFVVKKKTF